MFQVRGCSFFSHYTQVRKKSVLNGRVQVVKSNFPEDKLQKIIGKNLKFKLSNIPATINLAQFSEILSNNGIKFKKVIKQFGVPIATISFENQEQSQNMIRKVMQMKIDNKFIMVNKDKRTFKITPKVSEKSIEDICTPWWKISYDEQIKMKKEEASKILSDITKNLMEENKTTMSNIPWVNDLDRFTLDQDGYREICELKEVIPSPVIIGYRNKIAFTIGHDENKVITIGFVMGKFKEGILHLGSPANSVNCPVHANALVFRELFEEYLKTNSKLPVFDRETQEGFWRGIEIRTFDTGESTVTFQVEPTSFTEDVSKIKNVVAEKLFSF